MEIEYKLLEKLQNHFQIKINKKIFVNYMTKNTSKMSEYKKKIDPFLLDGSTQMISTTLAVLNVRKQHMSNFLNLENSSDGFDSNDKHDD